MSDAVCVCCGQPFKSRCDGAGAYCKSCMGCYVREAQVLQGSDCPKGSLKKDWREFYKEALKETA